MLWILLIGFVAGIIARMLSPGPNNPSGFILTTVLGIAGAFLMTTRSVPPEGLPGASRQQAAAAACARSRAA